MENSKKRLNVDLFDFKKSPNIGTYVFVTNKFALVPFDTPKYEKKKIKEVLEVPVFEAKINESDLLGVYLFGNEEKIVIPKGFSLICEKDITKKFGTRFFEVESEFNALSNNVAPVSYTHLTLPTIA
jgi:translation initiation factor 6 (eIF-6)